MYKQSIRIDLGPRSLFSRLHELEDSNFISVVEELNGKTATVRFHVDRDMEYRRQEWIETFTPVDGFELVWAVEAAQILTFIP